MQVINTLFTLTLLVLVDMTVARPKSGKNVIVCNEESLHKADLCGEKLFFVGRNARLFPTNEEGMNKYCSQTPNLVQCVKKYTDKCAHNDIQKNLANVMLYTARSHNKNICGSKTKRGQMVAMSRCANAIRKKSTDCMEKMLKEYGNALGLKEQRYRVPYACCAFNRMKACISAEADKAGKEVCADKPKELFEHYIDQMAGNTMELMCSDYDETSDKCTRVLKMPFNQSKAKPPNSLLRAFGDLLVLE